MKLFSREIDYQCWLWYERVRDDRLLRIYRQWLPHIVIPQKTRVLRLAEEELVYGINKITGMKPRVTRCPGKGRFLLLSEYGGHLPAVRESIPVRQLPETGPDGYIIKTVNHGGREFILIAGRTGEGILYGVHHFLRLLRMEQEIETLDILEVPANPLRMLNHWDNLDGSVERGYAGRSIFYANDQLTGNLRRINDYARLLASVGINGIVINNVNVHREETRLLGDRLSIVEKLADIFRPFGIKTFLSINFAAPLTLGELPTADPLDSRVQKWWQKKVARIYRRIPDFGGFLVKADSEHQAGPHTYCRNHAQGANMLAAALEPFGGLLIWRAFVYNCRQDWRDHKTDRAKAAYENFQPLDGCFADNVILQVKNGPMDFQVREPVSPLFGAMEKTNQMLELQVTQEYTGQQIHLCYLAPQWKEILDFETYARGKDSPVKKIVSGSLFKREYGGMAGTANIGDDINWTGHTLAQANLYAFARLAWNPDHPVEDITTEWIRLTFGNDREVTTVLGGMLLDSWEIYESYTAPLGIGWMVNPGCHYGPNVDGYEYSCWGTYHRANYSGIGVDRTVKTGTGFTGQYRPENTLQYESPQTCPEELVLFFHRLPYNHVLKNGKTLLQHIYDTHFSGAERAENLKKRWGSLKGKIDEKRFRQVAEKLKEQAAHAGEWRDVINTYFYRKTGIPDAHGRKIHP